MKSTSLFTLLLCLFATLSFGQGKSDTLRHSPKTPSLDSIFKAHGKQIRDSIRVRKAHTGDTLKLHVGGGKGDSLRLAHQPIADSLRKKLAHVKDTLKIRGHVPDSLKQHVRIFRTDSISHKHLRDSLNTRTSHVKDSIHVKDSVHAQAANSLRESLAHKHQQDSLHARSHVKDTTKRIHPTHYIIGLHHDSLGFYSDSAKINLKNSTVSPNPITGGTGVISVTNFNSTDVLTLTITGLAGLPPTTVQMVNGVANIDSLGQGLYFYKVTNQAGKLIAHGRFIVQ